MQNSGKRFWWALILLGSCEGNTPGQEASGQRPGQSSTGHSHSGCILKCMEVDWWTRGTAIYGAVLATVVGISQLLKDRAKVSVGAMLELLTDAGSTRLEFLVVKATNVGRRTVTISSVRKFPKMLEPTEEIAERMKGLAAIIEKITTVGVHDTEGREWRLPRKRLNQLKKAAKAYPQADLTR